LAQQRTTYNYDAIGPGYYDEVFRRNSGIQSKWHHLKFAEVRRQLPAGCGRLLDIGCGPGTFIGTLPEAVECVGTDLAAPQIEYANSEYGTPRHRFVCVKSGPLPFEDATFDAVTVIELIEHLPRPDLQTLLGEARRVLRPGGKLVLTTPNYASLWPLLEKIVNARAPVTYEDQHISFFTPGRLRAQLEILGFDRPRVVTFQGAAPFAAALGWKLADRLQNIENPILGPALGFLLLGTAFKA
jgi:SAM-dependent methyltransferase